MSADGWSLRIRGDAAEHPWITLGTLIRVDVEGPAEDPSPRREPVHEHRGQWAIRFDLPELLARDTAFGAVLETTLVRLGLLPTWMPEDLVVALRKPEPLGLVTDTNALSLGSFGHALMVRGTLPTHAGIPDQVYMELHKQREMQGRSHGDVKSRERPTVGERAQRRARATAAARVVRRLGRTHVLHVARPPDPLVRFLGSTVGSSGDDEEREDREGTDAREERNVGATVQRDRLILEAVRAHRAQLGRTKVWLLTNDAKFAAHASLEGFAVALCDRWRKWSRTLVSSPFIDPWSLSLHHRHLREVLEEFAWVFGDVAWVDPATGRGHHLDVPDDPHEQMLLECDADRLWRRLGEHRGAPDAPPTPPSKPSAGTSALPTPVAPSVETPATVPHRRAPSAATLVTMLVELHDAVPWSQSGKERRRHTSYLRALGWIEGEDDGEVLTDRGRALAQRWRALASDESVDAWAQWLRDAAADHSKLEPQTDLSRALSHGDAPTTLEDLAASLGWSENDVKTQVRLGNACGSILQIQQSVWATPWRDGRAARTALLAEVKALLDREDAIGGVRVGQVLVSVQGRFRMGLPAFREALVSLISDGSIVPGGATEDTGDPVGVLVPRDNDGVVAEYRTIDLRRGDWILPGRACQVVTLGRGAR